MSKFGPVVMMLLVSGAAGLQAQPKLELPKNMKQYFLVLLIKGPKADEPMAKAERDRLAQEHLAYVRSQIETGKYVIAGPATDNGKIAGMGIVNGASPDEVKASFDADPIVKSGRMIIEIHPVMLPDLSGVKVEYP